MMPRRFHGTIAMTCPSTVHAMLPDVRQPARLDVVMEPPACLLHVWWPEIGMLTHTNVIGDHGPLVTIHDGGRWLL